MESLRNNLKEIRRNFIVINLKEGNLNILKNQQQKHLLKNNIKEFPYTQEF